MVPRKQTVLLLADALQLTGSSRADFLAAANPHDLGRLATLSTAPPVTSLPRHPDPIIGRERTVRLAGKLLRSGDARWISLSGLVGVGKTRVAQAVAQDFHAGTRGPVVWVSEEEPHLSTQVRELLKNQAVGQLTELLGNSPALLVVDNLQQLRILPAAIARTLDLCPNLRLLTCDREPSRHRTSHELPISPLAAPEQIEGTEVDRLTEYPAVRLLLAHLHRLRPDDPVTDSTVIAVAHIAHALDGLPRALLAAASWLPLYESRRLIELARRTPLMLTETITDDLGDRRHDLVAALTASIDGLADTHGDMLHRLAHLPEPWSLGIAAREVGDTMPRTTAIVNGLLQRGLIRPVERADGEFGQFRLPNLVRHVLARPSSRRSPMAA